MLTGLAGFIYFIVNGLLNIIVLCLIISAVLSWLVAFNVINTRNPAIWRILDIVDRVTTPVLAPFRAVVPNVGGLDISYILCFLVIRGIQGYLLMPAAMTLQQLIG